MSIVYVLKLENNKYYVGQTNNISVRIEQHRTGRGAAWTKKYPPLEILEQMHSNGVHDENLITINMMKIYGIDNVRGGDYVTIELHPSVYNALHTRIYGTSVKCIVCGRNGHRTNDCYYDEDINGEKIFGVKKMVPNTVSVFIPKESDLVLDNTFGFGKPMRYLNEEIQPTHIPIESCVKRTYNCSRCGRPGHTKLKCFAKTHVGGKSLD